jgi:chaperonin cofactor prefoldin
MTTTPVPLPKHQLLDYVSKRDFNDFVGEMRDFKDMVGMRFDTIEQRLSVHDKRFDTIEQRLGVHDKRFDTIEQRLGDHDKRFNNIDRQFDELKELIRVQMGALHEQFREDLKIGLEYIQNVDDKKVDLAEFGKLKEKVDAIVFS